MNTFGARLFFEKRFYVLTLLISFISIISFQIKANEWHSIGNSREINISGMALVENNARETVFIVVHDNKKKKQKRAGIIKIANGNKPFYMPLEWLSKDLPVDLEAVTAIKGKPNNFMALTSAGKVYHIELNQNNNSVRVINSFNAPSIPSGSNFEGFTLQKIGDTQIAIWAERGEDTKPATIFWSKFDLNTYTFSKTESTQLKVAFPNTNVRHISDLKADSAGKIYISSAADAGNDGPFASAVYLAGNFILDNSSQITWNQSTELPRIFSIENRKIEAFEIIPGEKEKMVFGTDDENLGSAIYIDWQKLSILAQFETAE
jgi:hypothetical protein